MKNPWLLLQDVKGDAVAWPRFIRETFWNRRLNDHNRMILVNFAVVNGVREEFLHEVLRFTQGNSYTRDRRQRITQRFRYFEDPTMGGERRSRAYSFDLLHRRLLTLAGDFYKKKK